MKTFAIAALLSVVALPVIAQSRPTLPVGVWDNEFNGKPDCKKPFLTIEPNRIIERLPEGEGRCNVSSIKRKGQSFQGKYLCEWDASVPQGLRERPDDDENGFLLVIKSPTQILYNNYKFGLCQALSGSTR